MKIIKAWNYFYTGVWTNRQSNWKINTIKTLSLSVRSFLDKDVQSYACAMAFRTILSLVPAMALIFAIGRGFGLQNIIEDELYGLFPSQRTTIDECLKYVDSYLSTTTEGIFVGIGIIFLLYTLISLLSSVEDIFNSIWGIKNSRPLWRKITDYTAMLLILPVLIICSSSLTLFLSSALQKIFHFSFMTPVVSILLKAMTWIIMWIFFAAAYTLIPNTKVKFGKAFIAGIFAGSGFMILQWLFLTGQIYVTRYNAIYGSFALMPLLLLWLQLTWTLTLCGAVICYSSQNIMQFAFADDIKNISPSYRLKVTLALTKIIIDDFKEGKTAPTATRLADSYSIPLPLLNDILHSLTQADIVSPVLIDEREQIFGYAPAREPNLLTNSYITEKLSHLGSENFIPDIK